MASLLSAYLISNGAADTRYGGGQPRPGKGAKSEARPGEPELADRYGRRIKPPREAAEPPPSGKPDADRLSSQAEPRHRGRNARRLERAGERPDAAKPAEALAPAQQADQHGRDGSRRRPGKRGRPGRPVIDASPAWVRPRPRPANPRPPSPTMPSPMMPSHDAKLGWQDRRGQDRCGQEPVRKDRAGKRGKARRRIRWRCGQQTRRRQASRRGQLRGCQGRSTEGDRQQPAGAARRSGSPRNACAGSGFPGRIHGGSGANLRPAASSAPTAPPAPTAPAPPAVTRLRQRSPLGGSGGASRPGRVARAADLASKVYPARPRNPRNPKPGLIGPGLSLSLVQRPLTFRKPLLGWGSASSRRASGSKNSPAAASASAAASWSS